MPPPLQPIHAQTTLEYMGEVVEAQLQRSRHYAPWISLDRGLRTSMVEAEEKTTEMSSVCGDCGYRGQGTRLLRSHMGVNTASMLPSQYQLRARLNSESGFDRRHSSRKSEIETQLGFLVLSQGVLNLSIVRVRSKVRFLTFDF